MALEWSFVRHVQYSHWDVETWLLRCGPRDQPRTWQGGGDGVREPKSR